MFATVVSSLVSGARLSCRSGLLPRGPRGLQRKGSMDHGACPNDSWLHVGEPVQMSLCLANEERRTRVLVTGEIDIVTAAELHAFIKRAAGPGVTELMIDLTDVTFLDSSGIRVLIQAASEAAEAKIGFSLLCPSSNTAVGRVLDILQIGRTITVLKTDSRPR